MPWNTTVTHSINSARALMPCDTLPQLWEADGDDASSEWAVWGNPILWLLTLGTPQDSWAHIKPSLCPHVKTNECFLWAVSQTSLNQNHFLLMNLYLNGSIKRHEHKSWLCIVLRCTLITLWQYFSLYMHSILGWLYISIVLQREKTGLNIAVMLTIRPPWLSILLL